MVSDETSELHDQLRGHVQVLVAAISGVTIDRNELVDHLLDVMNLARGHDVGLLLLTQEMLEELPVGPAVSAEWWRTCLRALADHAAFLAGGYPAILPAVTV